MLAVVVAFLDPENGDWERELGDGEVIEHRKTKFDEVLEELAWVLGQLTITSTAAEIRAMSAVNI